MSSSRNDNEPFIFARVAGQVFYVQDNLTTDWYIAIEIKPRAVFANQEDNLGGMKVSVERRLVNEVQKCTYGSPHRWCKLTSSCWKWRWIRLISYL